MRTTIVTLPDARREPVYKRDSRRESVFVPRETASDLLAAVPEFPTAETDDLEFTDPYFILPASDEWNFGAVDFCISAAFTWSSLTANRDLIGKWKDAAGNAIQRMLLRYDGNGLTWYSAGNGTNFGANFVPTIGQAYDIKVSRIENAVFCYVDDVLLFTGPCGEFVDYPQHPLVIGAEGANGESAFPGTITDIFIVCGAGCSS